MTTPQPGTNDQVLIKLGEMSAQLAVISEKLTTVASGVTDHEGRIRKLEQWRYGLPLSGVLAAGSAGLSIYAAIKH